MDIKDLRRLARYLAGRTALAGAARLPAPVGRALFSWLGRALYILAARDRRQALANLEAAFPDWSRERARAAARGVFEEVARNIYDVAAFSRWPEAVRRDQLQVEGAEYLSGALAGGRGVLLVGGHMGAFELLAAGLVREGFPVTALARPVREARLTRWLEGHRAALGVRTIQAGGLGAALAARRVLAKGEVLGILLDHRIRRGGVSADFFGRPARFATGPLRLALHLGAPVLPAHIRRGSSGAHHLVIGPPLVLPEGAGARQVELATRQSVRALEETIREHPRQWAWFHPRWGRLPRGEMKAAWRRRAGLLDARHVVVAAAALAGALALGACERSEGPRSTESEGGPTSALGQFQVRETVSGRLSWLLSADSAQTFDRTGETVVARPRVDFYNEKQEIYSVLRADSGVVLRNTNNMTAQGNVTVITRDGDTLETETLRWLNLEGKVRTPDPFRLSGPGGVLTGTGFESDPGLHNYTTEDVRIDARSGQGDH